MIDPTIESVLLQRKASRRAFIAGVVLSLAALIAAATWIWPEVLLYQARWRVACGIVGLASLVATIVFARRSGTLKKQIMGS